MDSYEAVLEGVGVAISILREAPNIKIMATTRSPLHVKGENQIIIDSMDLPSDATSPKAMDYDAVQLFISAGERLHPGYRPSAASLEAIVKICSLVDGMPLGIILSTAWLKILSPVAKA